MPEVIFLGIGGAMATRPASNHTALIVRDGGATILLDSGPAIMYQLEAVGLNAGDPTHVFISHQHGDHALGLPMLLLNRMLFWPERPLHVVATDLVLSACHKLAAIAYPDLSRRQDEVVQFVPLVVDGTGDKMYSLPAATAISYALAPGQHSVPTWGIRLLLSSGHSVVYSGDTGPSEQIARLAQEADLLVHDSYYLSPSGNHPPLHSAVEQVAELAVQAGVRALALVHREHTSAPGLYRAGAAKHYGGTILVPEAGDRFTL